MKKSSSQKGVYFLKGRLNHKESTRNRKAFSIDCIKKNAKRFSVILIFDSPKICDNKIFCFFLKNEKLQTKLLLQMKTKQ